MAGKLQLRRVVSTQMWDPYVAIPILLGKRIKLRPCRLKLTIDCKHYKIFKLLNDHIEGETKVPI